MVRFTPSFGTLLLVFCIIGLSACNSGWGIKGEGPVVEQKRPLPEFHSIKSSVSADILLRQGRQQDMVIEAQQNILDNLKTEVQNGSLEIGFNQNVGSHEGIKIYITVPNIRQVSLSGSGSIRSDNTLKGDELDLNISGSGNMDIKAKYERLKSSIAGSGDMVLEGKGEHLEVRITGSGDVNALDFEVDNADIHVSGSGNVEVDVENRLDVSIAGSGDLRYKGRPVIKSSTSGSGNVSPIN